MVEICLIIQWSCLPELKQNHQFFGQNVVLNTPNVQFLNGRTNLMVRPFKYRAPQVRGLLSRACFKLKNGTRRESIGEC